MLNVKVKKEELKCENKTETSQNCINPKGKSRKSGKSIHLMRSL